VGNRGVGGGQLGNWWFVGVAQQRGGAQRTRLSDLAEDWVAHEKGDGDRLGPENEARACNPKNHARLALHQASRRDSAHRVV